MVAVVRLNSTAAQHEAGPSRKSLEALLLSQSNANDVYHAVTNATTQDLIPFGLKAYRMNLMSLFGETWSPEKILATARAATISKMLGGWEYHHQYLPSLTKIPDTPQLESVPVDAINAALEKGRGAVLMSFHIGHMRYLASDITHAGIDICAPLAGDSFSDYSSAKAANPDAALWQKFHIHNVELPGGAIALARTLAKGGCIFSTIDGNTGLDGTHGDQQRAQVQILGTEAKVKIGLFSLAARFGAPIIVMASHSIGGRKICRVGPSIDPCSRLSGAEKDDFIKASAQSAYSFFADMLTQHSDEWCGGDLFHQWRIAKRTPRLDPGEVELSLNRILQNGGRLIVNQRRILPLDSDTDMVWSDARSGSCYKLPQSMAGLVTRLTKPEVGIDRAWLDRQTGPARKQIWNLICDLASRDAVVEAASFEKSAICQETAPAL